MKQQIMGCLYVETFFHFGVGARQDVCARDEQQQHVAHDARHCSWWQCGQLLEVVLVLFLGRGRQIVNDVVVHKIIVVARAGQLQRCLFVGGRDRQHIGLAILNEKLNHGQETCVLLVVVGVEGGGEQNLLHGVVKVSPVPVFGWKNVVDVKAQPFDVGL